MAGSQELLGDAAAQSRVPRKVAAQDRAARRLGGRRAPPDAGEQAERRIRRHDRAGAVHDGETTAPAFEDRAGTPVVARPEPLAHDGHGVSLDVSHRVPRHSFPPIPLLT
jgi:hypothetical protein